MTAPDLSEALRRAVPDPPDLTGLAGRAEAAGRRSRARRRGAIGVASLGTAAAVAAAVLSLSYGTATDQRVTADAPTADVGTAVPCTAEADSATGGVVTQDGPDAPGASTVSVRFCGAELRQPGRDGAASVVPEEALTTDVEAVVQALDATVEANGPAVDCLTLRNRYRIQIGYDDGSTQDLPDQACDQGYRVLLEAIGRQQATGLPAPPTSLTCSDPGSPDRAAFLDEALQPLTRFPAVAALRCRQGADPEVTSVDDPQELRAALLSDTASGLVDCSGRTEPPKVVWVIRLADGSTHRVAYDRGNCGILTVNGDAFGLGGPLLTQLAKQQG